MNFHTLKIHKSAKRSKEKFIPTARTISKCNQKCTFLNDHLYTYLDYHLYAKMYQKMGVDSYAMVQNISKISKLRVLKPINKYDPILKIRVSDEIMTILDNKLIELFTT